MRTLYDGGSTELEGGVGVEDEWSSSADRLRGGNGVWLWMLGVR